ncbi:MAG TPA: GatB/YqeY domain-containing protein [Actinomycetota bacterium]|nr:GatB/YqeY domain-containing protein [Actinomycetota bacterium]
MGDEEGSLKRRLAAEMRAAMKERDAVRLGALRLLTAAVKNREVELRHELSDEEFVEVAAREVKRRREAIEAYEKAGREDRASTEREEQRVLESYLPAALSDQELGALIEEAVRATGATGSGDMGKVMGYVMGKAKGRVDGKAVQARVRGRLDQTV